MFQNKWVLEQKYSNTFSITRIRILNTFQNNSIRKCIWIVLKNIFYITELKLLYVANFHLVEFSGKYFWEPWPTLLVRRALFLSMVWQIWYFCTVKVIIWKFLKILQMWINHRLPTMKFRMRWTKKKILVKIKTKTAETCRRSTEKWFRTTIVLTWIFSFCKIYRSG